MDTVNEEEAPWFRALFEGVMASLRAVVPVAIIAFAFAIAGWAVTIDQQLPVSNVFGWTGSAVAVIAGFTLELGGVPIGLPPTLLTCVVWLLLYAAAKRVRRALEPCDGGPRTASRTRTLIMCGFVVLPVCGVALSALAPGVHANAVGAVRAAILVLSACFLGLRPGIAPMLSRLADHVGADPDELIGAVGDWTKRLLVALSAASVCLVALGLLGARGVAGDVIAQYSSPVTAAIGLGVLQVLYTPTIWAGVLAWVTGSGVTLSAGTVASVYQPTVASRPGFPILAAVPSDTASWMPWLGAVVVVATMVTVLGRASWQRQSSWSAVGIQIVVSFVLLTCVALFSTGSLGPGGLADFGVNVWRFPLVLTAFIAAGLVLARLMLLASARAEVNAGDDDVTEKHED